MYACKFQFQHLNSVYVHGAFCPVVFDVLVASSSPVEGRGRDNYEIESLKNNMFYLFVQHSINKVVKILHTF